MGTHTHTYIVENWTWRQRWRWCIYKPGRLKDSQKTTRSQEEGLEQILPHSLQKKPSLPTPWSWTFSLQSCETVSVVRSHSAHGTLLHQPKQTSNTIVVAGMVPRDLSMFMPARKLEPREVKWLYQVTQLVNGRAETGTQVSDLLTDSVHQTDAQSTKQSAALGAPFKQPFPESSQSQKFIFLEWMFWVWKVMAVACRFWGLSQQGTRTLGINSV